LTRRSYTSKEGKTAYVTEIVIDAINSIGSRKDNQSTKSIDQAFPENISNQSSPIEKTKTIPTTPIGGVDWEDDIKEKE
jgi:single-stranded DNA-binding protein